MIVDYYYYSTVYAKQEKNTDHQLVKSIKPPHQNKEQLQRQNLLKPSLRTAHKRIHFTHLVVSFTTWAWKGFYISPSHSLPQFLEECGPKQLSWLQWCHLHWWNALFLSVCACHLGLSKSLRDARWVCCKMADAPFNYTSHQRLMQ